MLYYIHQFFICILFLFSSACGSQPPGQSSNGNNEVALESSKNQNLNCASKVVANHVASPEFKKIQKKQGSLQVSTLSWQVDASLKNKYSTAFSAVEKAAKQAGTSQKGAVTVAVKIVSLDAFKKTGSNIPAGFRPKGGYLMQIKSDAISIFATEDEGVINALGSLEYLIDFHKGKLEQANILDWPDMEIRAAQIVLRAITPEVAIAAIDRMRRGHYNLVLLSISNNVQFKSLGKLANNCAWSVKDFLNVVKHARESGMEVVPELRFLSHQHKDFLVTGAYPELMYNEKTYDPRNEKVYKIVFAYIDEVIETLNPKAIHIGHDEVFGVSGRDAGAKDALPPNLFKEDVIKLHGYLKKKYVKTWMWGDMLITPSEFPNMHPGSINGTKAYAKLRKEIPKDIVICDWHYRDFPKNAGKDLQFPSLKAFADEGFEVLGATFRHPHVTREFAGYTAGLKNQNVKGMMATTWSFLRKGAQNGRQSDNYESFDDLIQYSAEAFWNGSKY